MHFISLKYGYLFNFDCLNCLNKYLLLFGKELVANGQLEYLKYDWNAFRLRFVNLALF